MEKKKPISLEERKTVQLEMLKEIDSFCRKNNIRYSLAFGTLLGAIRHKGFIPWDDDVDIMFPLPDLLRFKSEFVSETLEICDVDTTKHYEYAFPRIAHKQSYSIKGKIFKTYGINIDVYCFVSIPDSNDEQVKYFQKARSFKTKYWRTWRNRVIRRLPIRTIPFFDKRMKDYRDYLYYTIPYGSTNTFYVIAGPFDLRRKMTYDMDLFRSLVEVEFEGNRFMAIVDYDKFLQMRYGDYMQLPPEEERYPYHGGNYYWK